MRYLIRPTCKSNQSIKTADRLAHHRTALRYFLDSGTGNRKLNFPYIILQGIAIGDGLCDPISMTGYGDLLHGVGLINRFHQCHLDH